MSITTIKSIHCDSCSDWRYPNIGETMRDLRRALKRHGWRYTGDGFDYCAKCVAASRVNGEVMKEPT